MLVLMRRAGEAIHIGPDIVVTLVSLERNRARVGIDAPRHLVIDREEVALRKRNGIPPLKSPEDDAGNSISAEVAGPTRKDPT